MKSNHSEWLRAIVVVAAAGLVACESDDPKNEPPAEADTGVTGGTAPPVGGDPVGGDPVGGDPVGGDPVGGGDPPVGGEPVGGGDPPVGGGDPRVGGDPPPPSCSADDNDFPSAEWGECVSQAGEFVAFEPDSVSTFARVDALEEIAGLLWESETPPDATAFTNARVVYGLAEGIDSRLQRRYDAHYSGNVPDGVNCRDAGVPAQYPEYCIGPSTILPILNAAFDAGQGGQDPWENAARIEAGLLWFFYTSTYKEGFTCTTTKVDCDSAHAYYTGTGTREAPKGLARTIASVDPDVHSQVFDATLAVHCWREQDSGETAENLTLRDKALAEVDEALDHGAALVLADRIARFDAASGDERARHWAFIQVFGQALERAVRTKDSALADMAAAVFAGDGSGLDADGLSGAIVELLDCASGDDNPPPPPPPPPVCEADLNDFPSPEWGECPSQSGEFTAFEPDSISTIARIDAYEEMADLLWEANAAPDSMAFTNARVLYGLAEGLDSRIQRRYDSHYADDVPAGTNCRDEGVTAMFPQYCIGPSTIIPLLNAAFDAGQAGTDPLQNAARIDAALLWFLYVSVYKEANSCTSTKVDCDSSHGYYSGVTPRNAPRGLARVIAEVSPEAHEDIFDATLAVHCWREQDSAETAVNLELRDRALDEIDEALDFGFALVIADRLLRFDAAAGVEREAHWAWIQISGRAIARAVAEKDPALAQAAAAILGSDGSDVDAEMVGALLFDLFDCAD